MNFHYSTYIYNTTHRPQNHYSNVVVNQTDQYYFMPIREQKSTTTLAGNNVVDSSSLLLSDFQYPSAFNLFDDSSPNYFSSSTSNMNSSDRTTVNKSNNNYSLTDADLAALFVSSIVTTTPSPQTTSNNLLDNLNNNNNNNETSNNTLDDVFLHQVTDLACCSSSSSPIVDKQQTIGPPPGFENFRFDPSSTQTTSNSNPTISSISNAAIEIQVSSSDTINFSQLLESTTVDTQQQQPLIVGNVSNIRSSSSSHSSFASDEQSIFFPMSTHPYSSSSSILHASSQIFSTNTPSSSSTTTTATDSINSAAKPHIPNSLSLNNNNNNNNNNQFSSSSASLVTSSTTASPIPTTIETDTKTIDGGITPSHIFSSPNSFFSNGHTDFVPSKTTNKVSSTNRQSSIVARTSSSSASSSTSSSIDDALIQLTQQQQQQVQNVNKLFNDEPISIFHYPLLQSTTNIDKQQQAVHDNINFLASMATVSTPVTPESTWKHQQQPSAPLHSTASTSLDSNINFQRKMRAMILQQQQQKQQMILPQSSSSRNNSTNMQELMQNLNELCYKGFDELNALMQEERWVQNYVNVNSSLLSSPSSPSVHLNGSNCCSSRILIVPEYFIFKCKKVEITASHVYELLAVGRPELRLRELMSVFKSWKESILSAEMIHQEEENKLRLSTEHPHSYYMSDTVLQAAFDRVSYSIRQLGNITQQARATFQYATLNVFQTSSRQQQAQSQSSTSIAPAQLQAMQQYKSSSIHHPNGSLRTTP